MRRGRKELLVIGDRILVEPEQGETRTKVGLLLPAGVAEKEDVRGGTVVAIGPGMPLPPPQEEGEPWKQPQSAPRYLPMEVRLGDYALFFRKAAIEITFEGERYLVVPHAALLVVVREDQVPDGVPDEL
jgi:co-chaperonin GroES (HSP10)